MIISLGKVETEQELQDKLELLADKIDYANMVVYRVGDMFLVCNATPNYLITN